MLCTPGAEVSVVPLQGFFKGTSMLKSSSQGRTPILLVAGFDVTHRTTDARLLTSPL